MISLTILLAPVLLANSLANEAAITNLDFNAQTHDSPIIINGNADLLTQATTNGWSGSGTANDPIVIMNLHITTTISSPLINMSNTNLKVVIRDNFLDGLTTSPSVDAHGVFLNNVSNVIIENNDIKGVNAAILVKDSSNVSILGNSVQDVIVGISLSSSTLMNNNIVIARNVINGTQQDGLVLTSITNASITTNQIFNSGGSGITVSSSSSIIIIWNEIYDNGDHGINWFYGSQGNVTENIIANNTNDGIHAWYTTFILFQDLSIVFSENIIMGNGNDGLHVQYLAGIDIFNNTVTNNTRNGLHLERTFRVNVTMNQVLFNVWKGAYLDSTIYLWLLQNNISYNSEEGMYMDFTENLVMSRNTISWNGLTGIYFRSVETEVTHNLIWRNNGSGMILAEFNGIIVNNTFLDNQATPDDYHLVANPWNFNVKIINNTFINGNGIYLDQVQDFTIENNTFINVATEITVIQTQRVNITDYYIVHIGVRCDDIPCHPNDYENPLRASAHDLTAEASIIVDQSTDFILSNANLDGMFINNSAQVLMSNVTVNGNGTSGIVVQNSNFVNITDSSILFTHDGIYFDNVNNSLVNNTLVANSTNYGLQLLNPSTNNTIVNNTFIENGNNPSQARDDGYSNVFKGNAWSDYVDGTGNYLIDGSASNKDTAPKGIGHAISRPTVLSPNGGETLTGIVTIQWTQSTDSFYHAVMYDVFVSADDGITWSTLAADLSSTTYSWNTTTHANGNTYRLKIVAKDSFGTMAEDISDMAFTIFNDLIPPRVNLNGQLNGSTIDAGVLLDFVVFDNESSVLEVKYNWNGGENVTLSAPYDITAPFSDGIHVLTIFAMDEYGNEVVVRYVFTIGAPESTTTAPTTLPPETTITSPSSEAPSSNNLSSPPDLSGALLTILFLIAVVGTIGLVAYLTTKRQ